MYKKMCEVEDESKKAFIQGMWVSVLFFSLIVIIYIFCLPLAGKIFEIIAEFFKKSAKEENQIYVCVINLIFLSRC